MLWYLFPVWRREEYFDVMPYSLAILPLSFKPVHGPMHREETEGCIFKFYWKILHATFRDLGFAGLDQTQAV